MRMVFAFAFLALYSGCATTTLRDPPALYWLIVYENLTQSRGSGFVLNRPGKLPVVITNQHICQQAVYVVVTSPASETIDVVRVIRADAELDLCAIESPDPETHGLDLARHSIEGPLMTVNFGGSPESVQLNVGYAAPEARLVDTGSDTPKLLQLTTMTVLPGASGGAVMDSSLGIQGVITARNRSTSKAYMIPYKVLVDFVSKLP